ncbi:hypothetical protein AXX17_AT2G17720 [Arabidopsis thaliana]|uniref:MATH domain-containing protein n=2 Tax=Arabidopsis TaxID=3701 RepID=A0A178VWP3_ARATH|nr:hypothetical protein AXX17_AT2G17720 [Arabidopsis thaliana]
MALLDTFRFTQESITQLSSPIQRMCTQRSSSSSTTESTTNTIPTKVYPNGDGFGKGNSSSVYLLSESNEKAYVRAKLRVLDQIRSNHVEKLVDGWPNATAINNGWGFEKFVPFADLKNASKGLVVEDALKVEVEFIGFSKTQTPP